MLTQGASLDLQKGSKSGRFVLTKLLATRIISDYSRSEYITTWMARHTSDPKEPNYILRVFDQYSAAEPPRKLCDGRTIEPGQTDAFEDEIILATKLAGAGCSSTLAPSTPSSLQKVYMKLGDTWRCVLIYRKPDGDDWVGLGEYEEQEQLAEHYTEVKKAFKDAIQELFAKRYYLVHDDYTQVIWSATKQKCMFLNLTSARKAPGGMTKDDDDDEDEFDPESELAGFAFPIY